MAAVVRVKRRINEEPLSAFVLNCKKQKLDDGETNNCEAKSVNLFESTDEVSTILKFAGTVETQSEPITQITRLSKCEAKQLAQKTRTPNLTEKSRQEMRQNHHESRFKVVNYSRAIDTMTESEEPKPITILDIEKHTVDSKETKSNITEASGSNATISASHSPTDSDGFVYDLYIPENDEHIENLEYMDNLENCLSIRPFDDLIYEERYIDEEEYESDDSNQENYFANDYPDEEDDDNDSVTEDDMVRAVRGYTIDEDLSSDDDDHGFVHSIDSDRYGFKKDLDYYGFVKPSGDERDDSEDNSEYYDSD